MAGHCRPNGRTRQARVGQMAGQMVGQGGQMAGKEEIAGQCRADGRQMQGMIEDRIEQDKTGQMTKQGRTYGRIR